MTELWEIAHDQVVSSLSLQDLSQGVAAHGGLDRILYVRDIDLITGGLPAIHRQIQIRLTQKSKDSKVFDSLDLAHNLDDLIGFILENSQVVAVDLRGKLSLYTA